VELVFYGSIPIIPNALAPPRSSSVAAPCHSSLALLSLSLPSLPLSVRFLYFPSLSPTAGGALLWSSSAHRGWGARELECVAALSLFRPSHGKSRSPPPPLPVTGLLASSSHRQNRGPSLIPVQSGTAGRHEEQLAGGCSLRLRPDGLLREALGCGMCRIWVWSCFSSRQIVGVAISQDGLVGVCLWRMGSII
jgi:hypothetical protein